eukprot:4648881-Ditylum_brightwellii.AAC.1
MGYNNIKDIGLQSFRKGPGSLLASLPGGPAAASPCLRAGWSMGQVRDIYLQQTQAAYISDDVNDALVDNPVKENFPHFQGIARMGQMLR